MSLIVMGILFNYYLIGLGISMTKCFEIFGGKWNTRNIRPAEINPL